MTRRLVLLAVLMPAFYFGWQWLFPDHETEIRALLARIEDGIENEDDQGAQGLARVAALQNDFAVDATVEAGPPFQRLNGRQAIVAAAARVRVAVRNLDVEFTDVEITIAANGESASAFLTAEARFDEAGGRAIDARELEIAFSRTDRRWVVSSVVVVQALKRL